MGIYIILTFSIKVEKKEIVHMYVLIYFLFYSLHLI